MYIEVFFFFCTSNEYYVISSFVFSSCIWLSLQWGEGKKCTKVSISIISQMSCKISVYWISAINPISCSPNLDSSTDYGFVNLTVLIYKFWMMTIARHLLLLWMVSFVFAKQTKHTRVFLRADNIQKGVSLSAVLFEFQLNWFWYWTNQSKHVDAKKLTSAERARSRDRTFITVA